MCLLSVQLTNIDLSTVTELFQSLNSSLEAELLQATLRMCLDLTANDQQKTNSRTSCEVIYKSFLFFER